MKRLLTVAAMILVCIAASSQVTLVKGGKAKARIVVVGDGEASRATTEVGASRATAEAKAKAAMTSKATTEVGAKAKAASREAASREAAEMMADFVGRISGAELAVVEGMKPRRGDVVIGETTEEAGEDGYLLDCHDGVLHVASGGGSGAINGVVALLEEQFGVEYLAADFCVCPKADEMVVPEMRKASTPAFRYRQTYSYGNNDPIYRKWHALENPGDMFISNMWVHTFNRILPSKRFGKDHPEYYSLINGERRPGTHSQWCLTNPDVFDAVVIQLDSIFRANPDLKMVSVSQNDGNDTYCHCPECMKVDEEEGAHSGNYIRFLNKLAERFPDKEFSTLAYLFTMDPPRNVKPLPNVNIMLCDIDCKREVPLTDNESGRHFVRALEGWSAISDNIFVWDYGINFDNIVSPFPNFHVLGKNMALFKDNHVTMHFAQVNGIKGGDFSEMRAYILAKLMWDPYQDVDTLMKRFMEGYYGAAAPYLYQYQKIMEGALLASGIDLWIYDSPISHKDGMLNAELRKTYNELFDKAEAAVDGVLLDHVRLSRLSLQYAELEIARTTPAPASEVEERLRALNLFEERCAYFGVEMLNERHNRPEDYCRLYRERFLPAARKSLALGAPVTYLRDPEPRYQPIAGTALTDGLYGGTTYVESWVGWEGHDASFVIDLGSVKEINEIETDFLHQLGAWILLPKGGRYSVSGDGTDFREVGSFAFGEDRDLSVKFVPGRVAVPSGTTARYIKVDIDTLGLCPDWHYGVGYPAWFFIDEVNVY